MFAVGKPIVRPTWRPSVATSPRMKYLSPNSSASFSTSPPARYCFASEAAAFSPVHAHERQYFRLYAAFGTKRAQFLRAARRTPAEGKVRSAHERAHFERTRDAIEKFLTVCRAECLVEAGGKGKIGAQLFKQIQPLAEGVNLPAVLGIVESHDADQASFVFRRSFSHAPATPDARRACRRNIPTGERTARKASRFRNRRRASYQLHLRTQCSVFCRGDAVKRAVEIQLVLPVREIACKL